MIFGFFKKRTVKKSNQAEESGGPQEEVIGKITHYFPRCKACVVKVESPLNIGDTVHIKGHTTDFKQKVASMQIEGESITNAKKGQEIGIRVKERVRNTDIVYKAAN